MSLIFLMNFNVVSAYNSQVSANEQTFNLDEGILKSKFTNFGKKQKI